MNETTDYLSTTLANDALALARALRGVRKEADEALRRMTEGGRPSTSITGSLLPSARDVDALAGRVELLVNWSGSPLMPHDKAEAALRATTVTRPGMHDLRVTGEDLARIIRALDTYGDAVIDGIEAPAEAEAESDAARALRVHLAESLADPAGGRRTSSPMTYVSAEEDARLLRKYDG